MFFIRIKKLNYQDLVDLKNGLITDMHVTLQANYS